MLDDFLTLREQLTSIEQLSAFRTARHNLVAGAPPYEPISVAEMTASGFAVVRTPPLLGRYLVPEDEREGAAPVLVVGYDAWQSRFAGDAQIVGRVVNLGGTQTVVVGVMPEGFRFPLDHQYWMPLRLARLRAASQPPRLFLFGRLAQGVSPQQAQAELTAVGQRAAPAAPAMPPPPRPVVLAYTHEHFDLTDPFRVWLVRIAQLLVSALTFVVAVNLAILIYARTVTRIGEIAVRTALGASRRRILAQLFIEAFALTLVGTVVGLVLARSALGTMESMAHANGAVPFWIRFDLSLGTVIHAVMLAGLAAVVMGVLPGLKATGRGLSANLHELHGRGGTRLGRLWTTLVIGQVAVAVAVLPVSIYTAWHVVRVGAEPDFPAGQFAVGIIALADDASAIDRNRVRSRQLELTSRLEAEPGVTAVAFSSSVPGFLPGRLLRFEESPAVKYAGGELGVDSVDVDVNLFSDSVASFRCRTTTIGCARSGAISPGAQAS